MKRFSDEDGINAGYRNFGRFFLFAIPAVIALAAAAWLGVYIGVHNFRRELSQEDRRAIFVGAWQRPKDKLIIETPENTCMKVTHVDLDGETAAVYFINKCGSVVSGSQVHFQMVSPDGTLLKHGWDFADSSGLMQDGEQGEAIERHIPADSRASAVRFWIEAHK